MTNPPTNHGGGGGGTSPGRAPGGPGRSVYQQSYRSPQGLTDYDRRMPTTRFGSTLNRAAAAGVGTFVDCIFAGINSGGGTSFFLHLCWGFQGQIFRSRYVCLLNLCRDLIQDGGLRFFTLRCLDSGD